MELKFSFNPGEMRNKKILDYLQKENNEGRLPQTHKIENNVSLSRSTTIKYLELLELKRIVKHISIGQSKIWYVSKDKEGNTIFPVVIFSKKE